jgi:hypothetical protein
MKNKLLSCKMDICKENNVTTIEQALEYKEDKIKKHFLLEPFRTIDA